MIILNKITGFFIIFLLTLSALSGCSGDAIKEVKEIGTQKQLFLDDSIIESSESVTLTMNPPRRTGAMTGISLAKLRLDGFVSADADYPGGEITTGLIRFGSSRMDVNLDTGGGGSLQIEILDESGKPIKGFTQSESELLVGNSVKMPVTWKNKDGVSELAGKSVRLRFLMSDCKLYSFQFVN